MSLDGITVYASVCELNGNFKGERIEKIYQVSNTELVFLMRGNKKIFISASPDKARISQTSRKFENPQNPPMFCMLLRKHLVGGRIVSIEQQGMDRICRIIIENYDEFGELSEKTLIVEMTGKTSNIILMDKDGKVIDLIKRVYGDISKTEILPGMKYIPEISGKMNILDLNYERFLEKLKEENKTLKGFLISTFEGVGPITSKEIIDRANLSDMPIFNLKNEELEKFYETLESFKEDLKNKNFSYTAVYDDSAIKKVLACYPFPLKSFNDFEKKTFDSMSEMLEEVYSNKDNFEIINNYSANLKKLTNNLIKKLEKKIQKQKLELLEARDREKFKIYADLLQSNLYKPYNNETSITVENYYDPELKPLEIPLDCKLSLVKNAQRYYKLYQKQKNRENLLSKEIPKVEREKEYLEQIALSLEQITKKDEVAEIKEELENAGYIKREKGKKKKVVPSSPMTFKSSEGFTMRVGKNNRQNDELTFNIAKPDDIWLHARNMPGSHVIISCEGREVPNNTMEEAAYLAKYYSTAKNLPHASVDYTTRKNVKRMRGAKPGMVNYYEFKTIYISDDRDIGMRILKE